MKGCIRFARSFHMAALPHGSASCRTAAAAALFLTIGWSAQAQSFRQGDQITGEAVVVDGSSLDIKSNRIRLWGIDVPERGAFCFRNNRRWKPADEVAAALRRCVAGKTVTCRV